MPLKILWCGVGQPITFSIPTSRWGWVGLWQHNIVDDINIDISTNQVFDIMQSWKLHEKLNWMTLSIVRFYMMQYDNKLSTSCSLLSQFWICFVDNWLTGNRWFKHVPVLIILCLSLAKGKGRGLYILILLSTIIRLQISPNWCRVQTGHQQRDFNHILNPYCPQKRRQFE